MKTLVLNQRKNLQFLIAFVPGIFWWLFSFPARLSADSLMTIQQVRDGVWDSWHTLAYRFFVQLTSINGQYIYLTSLSQIIICTISCLYFLKCLNIGSRRMVVYTAILMSTPYGGGISSTIWKDSISGSLLIFLAGSAVRFIESKKTARKRESAWLLALGILFSQFRNENSIVLLLVAILLSALAFTKHLRKRDSKSGIKSLAKIIAAAAVIGAVFFNLLTFIPGVVKLPASYKYLTVGSNLAFVSSTLQSKDADLAEYVANFSTDESYSGASYCGNIIAFAYFKGSNWDGLVGLNPSPYVKWIQVFFKYPHLILKHHYCNSLSFLPFPISTGPSYVYLLHDGIDQNSLNLKQDPFLRVEKWGVGAIGSHLMSLFSKYLWPGMLITIMTFVLIYKKKLLDQSSLIVMSIAYATTIILFLSVGSQDFRYATGNSILMILFFFVTIFKKTKVKF
jgi:hypothetical protein